MAVSGLFSDGVWTKPALAICRNEYPETLHDRSTSRESIHYKRTFLAEAKKQTFQFCSTHIKLIFDNETLQLLSNQTTRNFSHSSSVPQDSQIPLIFEQWARTNSYLRSFLYKADREQRLSDIYTRATAAHFSLHHVSDKTLISLLHTPLYTRLGEMSRRAVIIHWPLWLIRCSGGQTMDPFRCP